MRWTIGIFAAWAKARGGGAKDLEVRFVQVGAETHLVVHLIVDTQDAMGANLINTMCEGVASLIERTTGGRVRLRILSNLADLRLARASCRIPFEALADFGFSGAEVAHGIAEASRFADADPYRACTHNKGVMNGVDAVALATGNDWRAIEAGAHAYCARNGRYEAMTKWWVSGGALHGSIEIPIQVGTVGGAVKANPLIPVLLKMMGNPGAQKLAGIMAAVGLAQNMAALRALGTVGIQKGHMALHARNLAVSAGAKGSAVEEVAGALDAQGFKAGGGGEPAAALDPSVGVELLHAYLLIHDDFMDRDEVRRGGPTIHAALGGDHLAGSVAILLGSLCQAWAWELVLATPVVPERALEAARLLATSLQEVTVGQTLDVVATQAPPLDPAGVLEVQRLKTGSYSFELPLRLGALLAGAAPPVLDALSRYARPLGQAFQIADDLLGTFGAPEV